MIFTKLKTFFYVGILFQVVSIHCNKTTFSRANVGVIFNPVRPGGGIKEWYSPEDLIPMVSLIASKFSKVSTTIQDESVIEKTSEVKIPAAVAIYNRFHLKTRESPLELFVTFSINNIPNGTATNSTPDGWDSLINILDEANNIFPETIKRIYIEHYGIMSTIMSMVDDLEVAKFENYFVNAQFPKSEKYELGISLIIFYCESAELQRLERFRHLSFYWWPNCLESLKNEEPQMLIQRFLKVVSYCRQKVEGYGKNVQTVRIETGWLWENETDGPEHDKKSLSYWAEVNDWAEGNNMSVDLWEAFDDLDGSEGSMFDQMGIWRLVPNVNYKNISEFVFEEKGTVHSLSSIPWGLVCLIMLIIFVVSLIAGLLFIRYFYPNTFYTKVVPYLPEFPRFRQWVTRVFNFCASKL